jgi:hypothetical protein
MPRFDACQTVSLALRNRKHFVKVGGETDETAGKIGDFPSLSHLGSLYDHRLMAVVVSFCFMSGMVMIMGTMFVFVFMVMHVGSAAVNMIVFVFMKMLVNMRVRMFMRVFHLSVAVFMLMAVRMLMRMQMFVFMGSVHSKASFQGL